MPIELIYRKESIKKDGLEANLQSPFKVAIKTIANRMNIYIACPYINIDVLKDIIKDAKTWLLLTDLEAWLKTANSDTVKQIQTFLNEHNAFVRHSQGLHAKLILNQEIGLLGSANFTINGINNNTELSVLLDEKTVITELLEWFNQLWKQSTPVIELMESIKSYIDDLSEYEKEDVRKKPQPKLFSKKYNSYIEEVKTEHNDKDLIVSSEVNSVLPSDNNPPIIISKIKKNNLQTISLNDKDLVLRGQQETVYWESDNGNLTIYRKGQANGLIKQSKELLIVKPTSLIVSKNKDKSINRSYKIPNDIEKLNEIRQNMLEITLHKNTKKYLHMNIEGILIDTEKYTIMEIEEKVLSEVEVDLYGLSIIYSLSELDFGQVKIPKNIRAIKGIYDEREIIKNAWRFFFYLAD